MNVVERAKNIILKPRTEWEAVKAERLSVSDMFNLSGLLPGTTVLYLRHNHWRGSMPR